MAGFFGMFDYTKPGKGVSKEDLDKSGIALYFDILGRRIWKIILLNLIYFIFSIPGFIISWVVSGYLFSTLLSLVQLQLEPIEFQVLNLFLSTVVILLFGSGSASAAMSYVLRKYVNDTHSWVWSDFWDNFKSNFIQGTLAFVINMLVLVLGSIGLMFYTFLMQGVLSSVLSAIVGVMLAIFIMMQMYVYQIMASFKLKLKDIYRNALLLTVGKLPVSIITIAVTAVFIYLLNLIITNAFSIIALALVFYAFPVFTQIFMTNNTIRKYLLEPSEKAAEATEE